MEGISDISFNPAWLSALVIAAAVTWFVVRTIRDLHRPYSRHRRCWAAAKRVSRTLRARDMTEAAKMTYLRRIDPFVFEELVLYSFRRSGCRVRRNRRYSGDGGSDGIVWIDGRKHLLQMKRYSGYISAVDVRDFTDLCRHRHCHGLFVHTGRTGAASKEQAERNDRVEILSGARLLRLVVYNTYIKK